MISRKDFKVALGEPDAGFTPPCAAYARRRRDL